MLDTDLALLYGVTTKRLNEQVKRNGHRFPEDFMFRLTAREKAEVVANCDHLEKLKFSPTRPLAFTEHGALMVASILNSETAVEVGIYVVRAFVKLREMLATHRAAAQKLSELEQTVASHDRHIRSLFEAIRRLMTPPASKSRNLKPATRNSCVPRRTLPSHQPYAISSYPIVTSDVTTGLYNRGIFIKPGGALMEENGHRDDQPQPLYVTYMSSAHLGARIVLASTALIFPGFPLAMAEPGFDSRYERDYNIFNPANVYAPDNPLNPANAYNPNSFKNPANIYDPGNPANPANIYQPDNPFNPANRFRPDNPLNPANQYNPSTPFAPLGR
jgi:hypothetical protein